MKYNEENFLENLFRRIKERENKKRGKLRIKDKFKLIQEIPLSFKFHWQVSDYFLKNYEIINPDVNQIVKEFPLGNYTVDMFMKLPDNSFGITEIKINHKENSLWVFKNTYKQLKLYEKELKKLFKFFDLPIPKLVKYAIISDRGVIKIYNVK